MEKCPHTSSADFPHTESFCRAAIGTTPDVRLHMDDPANTGRRCLMQYRCRLPWRPKPGDENLPVFQAPGGRLYVLPPLSLLPMDCRVRLALLRANCSYLCDACGRWDESAGNRGHRSPFPRFREALAHNP